MVAASGRAPFQVWFGVKALAWCWRTAPGPSSCQLLCLPPAPLVSYSACELLRGAGPLGEFDQLRRHLAGFVECPPPVYPGQFAGGELGEQVTHPGRFRFLHGEVVLRLDEEQPGNVPRVLRQRVTFG